MTRQKIDIRTGLLFGIVLIAALSRLIPHYPNVTPISGMALFGAAYFSRKWMAALIPFAALWLSDLILNNTIYASYSEGFSLFGSPWVYLAFGLIVVMGWLGLKKISLPRVIGVSVSASLLFFLITNFGSWLAFYPNTVEGLIACYGAAIPFLRNTILGDLFYVTVLFGAFELVQLYWPKLALKKQS
jgi:hypothetical protein